MNNEKLIDQINKVIAPHKLSEIYSFYGSVPVKFKDKATNANSEVAYQREVYKHDLKWINDGIEWLDLELPVGQNKGDKKVQNKAFIDLIGKRGNEYILCELKYNENSDNPYDAMQQVLTYYVMIIENCTKMSTVFHPNNKLEKQLSWCEIAKKLIIQLRAPKDYWETYSKEMEDLSENYIIKLENIGITLEVVEDYPICK